VRGPDEGVGGYGLALGSVDTGHRLGIVSAREKIVGVQSSLAAVCLEDRKTRAF